MGSRESPRQPHAELAAARHVFYHHQPFIRRSEVDLVREMTDAARGERLSRHAGGRVLDLMREIMTVRRRELWGTTYGDPAHVLRADVGRGLQIFLWGLPPERRLPIRAYVAGFSLKNGVPVNYIEAIGLCEWLEVGFNTFYTFRDGESAWNYCPGSPAAPSGPGCDLRRGVPVPDRSGQRGGHRVGRVLVLP